MSDGPATPSVPEIEQVIRDRQDHLAATLDELDRRLQPSRLARSAADDATASARGLVIDPATGGPRVERIAAVGAAALVLLLLSIIGRVRARRRARR